MAPRLVTHADRMPLAMHTNRLIRSPENPRARALYHGSYEWSPQFAEWLGESVGTLERPDVPEVRLPPEQWWRSSYLVARLQALFPPALIDALVRLHQAQATEHQWETRDWDGDPDRFDARQMVLFSTATVIACDARVALDLPTLTHERALSWLTREGERVEETVWRRYYPQRRRRAR